MRIVIDGNVGSGKSTAINALVWKLGAKVHPEPVERWASLLRRFYKNPSEASMDLQIRVLMDLSSIEDVDGEVHVIERSPDSSIKVFAKIARTKGWITHAQFDSLDFTRESIGWSADAFIFIDTPPKTCFERISKRSIGSDASIEPKDYEYLEEISSRYETMISELSCPVLRIDGSASAEHVLQEVVDAIKKFAKGHDL
jgi:deoxyadenosine/deoxycytidine kinase